MSRIENDLIGSLPIPKDAYYGIHTQRAIDNFQISGVKLSHFPEFIKALAYVKWAAAETNCQLGALDSKVSNAIIEACKKIIAGEYLNQFPSDMLQGGAGTSTNMNINEVVANIALEIMGHGKAEYSYCSPYDHVNLSQSTNDAYPTGVKLGILFYNAKLENTLKDLVESIKNKGQELKHVITMGRTHLQDAIPMTLGQEFDAYAATLEKEIDYLKQNADQCLEINMGATAVGTGLNAIPGYDKLCAEILSNLTGLKFTHAANLVEATSNTGSFVAYSSALKRLAIKLSKICNDLRILTSGPRCGMYEINLPPRQAGSSIMPGKVNPVIAEVTSQTCFKVIGNDLAVMMASEAGQLQLNVMEPVMAFSILESQNLLTNVMTCLRKNCIEGITANEEHCKQLVQNSIGIVTALNPYIGYENSTTIAQEALATGQSVYDLVLKKNVLSKEELDRILNPENMTGIK
ncbi:aspartate ammonia-lyase [Dysgonomonas sp. Marseille-P4677]|uniref:aspartate ammonia-lyase n=1 Tax=Dysgonomonas sp. Marseille-P4677 TaxID=2364790 RepID=UPI001913A44D|nr:aspartate ammonia-lyase [Dysgonomonas sp. Marseille-P4677]MBK5721218.1 aspartate ammonia-lyase [Dysgonomonas sp. Marseille-P4677]